MDRHPFPDEPAELSIFGIIRRPRQILRHDLVWCHVVRERLCYGVEELAKSRARFQQPAVPGFIQACRRGNIKPRNQ